MRFFFFNQSVEFKNKLDKVSMNIGFEGFDIIWTLWDLYIRIILSNNVLY